MHTSVIVVAGATGVLGGKIIRSLVDRKANVRALVRRGTPADKLAPLQKLDITICQVDFNDENELIQACTGAGCVVSALSGLRDVIVDLQGNLLEAAVKAGVPRFIPSDFSLDFTLTPPGRNRNLDWRREFHTSLDAAPIVATSIFNGAFTELLTGQAPFILFKLRRVLCWNSAEQQLDFTTMDDTAAFTAAAALDPATPRKLHIVGDRKNSYELAAVVSNLTGFKFSPLRAGSLKMLSAIITIVRALKPAKQELFPAWQGMQYMCDMFSGLANVEQLDNQRYPELGWQSINDVLARFLRQQSN